MTLAAAPTASHRSRQVGGLVWTLVRTDFVSRYHGTIGGFLWALLKPLAMFLVLMAVFSFVFADTAQYRLNLVIGLFLYEFFQESTKAGLLSLRARGYLLTKARFPAWVLVVTSASNAVITLALFSMVLIAFLSVAGQPPSPAAVALYVLYLLEFMLVVTGFSLAASVLFMQYRDLNQVWEVVTQAGFFVAPIVYPLDVLPEHLHRFLFLWPPTPVIQFARDVLVQGTPPSLLAHLLLTAEAAGCLAIGALVYRRFAPRVPEYL
jgi:lipopolysaccharide transport system permease protein